MARDADPTRARAPGRRQPKRKRKGPAGAGSPPDAGSASGSGRRSRLADRGQVVLRLTVPAQVREPLLAIAQRLRAGESLDAVLDTLHPEHERPPPVAAAAGATVPQPEPPPASGIEPGEPAAAPAEMAGLQQGLAEAQALLQDRAGQIGQLEQQSAKQSHDITVLRTELARLDRALDDAWAARQQAEGLAQAQQRRADELFEKLDRTQSALMQARNTGREDRHFLVDIRRLPGWLRWWVERHRPEG